MNAIPKRAAGADLASLAPPVPNDPELLGAYFRQVQSYQANEAKAARRSRRVAWAVAAGFGAIAGLACAAVVVLETRKPDPPAPIVLRVDNVTGAVDRVYDVVGGEMAATEAVRRFYAWQYVRLRQSYGFAEAQYNFNAVTLMSTAEVQQQYADWFRGSNPQSPQVLLGRTGMATVSWVSTQFDPANPKLVFVRFIQTERKGEQIIARRNMIATIGFDFARGAVKGSDINLNPHGFLVTSYHADQENTQ